VVNVATSVTSQLPAPAGGLATRVLTRAGSTVDKVLGPTGVKLGAGRVATAAALSRPQADAGLQVSLQRSL
jgi:hypothetical protein